MQLNHELAECVGLWLAEGDSKTKSEVTFTNNCKELILHFHNNLKRIYLGSNLPRIYIYSKTPGSLNFKLPLENVRLKQYPDIRANKPYCIYRLASVTFVKLWKELVEFYLSQKDYYPDILRGIFAGEGNIHTGEHSNRTLRVSQVNRIKQFEQLFDALGLKYKYSAGNRMYNFTHKENWDIFAKNRLADLHCDKKAKFWKTYNSYKQNHYRKHFIRDTMLCLLTTPKTKGELAVHFSRSEARIYDILSLYKKEGKIINFCVYSKAYWVRKDSRIIIISRVKNKYINLIKNSNKTTQEFAKDLKVSWKSSFKRLSELKKLGLVTQKNMRWKLLHCDKKVIIL
ncbi:MAG: hypothetical protein V1702_02415 [Candidatus Woesearchaeota archaeon]